MKQLRKFAAAGALALAAAPAVAADQGTDWVKGNLILFNDNGAWCWFQDERAIVDPVNHTLLMGSVAAAEGVDGTQRTGDIDLTTFDLASGERRRVVLHHHLLIQDDHNAPALLIRPDGKYLAVYAKHNLENLTYWRVSTRPHDASEWEAEKTFDWTEALATADPKDHVTYSNLFYLSAEDRVYDFVRGVNHDPSILISSDQGDSFSYAGKLLTEKKLGYVNGYVKYASNGVDRVDFITTEHHPRDFSNSVYHGYLENGTLHRSDGTVVHGDVFDRSGVPQTELTKVFAAGSVWNGETMSHAWTVDLHVDAAGRPYGLLSARANDIPDNTNFSDHRFFYARYDGSKWQVHQLAKAGPCLWPAEQDYTGLGAVDPNDPNVVYISTPIDPRDQTALKVHEIFRGETADGGAGWTWTAITRNSTVDNMRPLVAPWEAGNTAVLWFRGTMSRSQHYDSAIVGLVERGSETAGPVHYVAATSGKTTLSGLGDGDYDVFTYFWADPAVDRTVHAGLAADRMLTLRARFCQQAQAEEVTPAVQMTDGKRALYRAYVGRVSVKGSQIGSGGVDVFADDAAGVGYAKIQTGATAPQRR